MAKKNKKHFVLPKIASLQPQAHRALAATYGKRMMPAEFIQKRHSMVMSTRRFWSQNTGWILVEWGVNHYVALSRSGKLMYVRGEAAAEVKIAPRIRAMLQAHLDIESSPRAQAA